MKNILVTGGAGFIGSHTVVELLQSGYNPVIVDDFRNSKKSVLDGLEKITNKKVRCYEYDYTDATKLVEVIKKESIDGVIHFAAYKAVGESVKEPLKYYENNVVGLVKLLEILEQLGISNIVFSSSCTVYGESDTLPITEHTPLKPAESPYGATKQMGEVVLKTTTAASNTMKSIALRYFNPVGAHPSAHISELPLGPPSILVPFITQAVAGIRDKLTVFGNDYETPDGTCVRDYIHVVDLARAHISALEYIDSQTSGFFDVFNIGTGKGSSVLEVITTFEQVSGKKVPYEIGARRAGDVVTSYANADKAMKLLKWKAQYNLSDALRDAWRWQEKISA